MADSPPPSDTADDIEEGPGSASSDGTPRWMKVVGMGIIVLVVLVLVLVLSGGGLGGHGPGMHTP